MASNNLRKRQSHLSTPANATAKPTGRKSASTTQHSDSQNGPSPPKRARLLSPSSSHRSKTSRISDVAARVAKGYCSLGLRNILGDSRKKAPSSQQQQNQQTKHDEQHQETLGPLIPLCPMMYLGRTPPSMIKAMTKIKSLETTWSSSDFRSFTRRHEQLGKAHAMLGIDRRKDPPLSKTEDELLMSVSRKLLQIVDNHTSVGTITLQRCPEARKSDGRPARQIPVEVIRRLPGRLRTEKENDSSLSSNSSSSLSTNSAGKASNVVHVQPNSRVILREGDTLMILNNNYRYRVVANSEFGASPKKRATGTAKAAVNAKSDVIDLAGSSSSDSMRSPFVTTRKKTAVGSTSSHLRKRTRERSSIGGRTSFSSINDRTIDLDCDDEDEIIEIQSSSSSSSEVYNRKQPIRKIKTSTEREVIEIQSSSSSEDGSQKKSSGIERNTTFTPAKSKPTEDKFQTPDCKTSGFIGIAKSSSSSNAKEARAKTNGTNQSNSLAKDKPNQEHSTKSISQTDKIVVRTPPEPKPVVFKTESPDRKESVTVAITKLPSTDINTTDTNDGIPKPNFEKDEPGHGHFTRSNSSAANRTPLDEIPSVKSNNKSTDFEASGTTSTAKPPISESNAGKNSNTKNTTSTGQTNNTSQQDADVPKSPNRPNTRFKDRRKPAHKWQDEGKTKEKRVITRTSIKGEIIDLRTRLRQNKIRIKTVFLQEENGEGTVVETPIPEIINSKKQVNAQPKRQPKAQSKTRSKRLPTREQPKRNLNEKTKGEGEEQPEEATNEIDANNDANLALKYPTRRFWDPSWSGEVVKIDSAVATPTKMVAPTTEGTKTTELSTLISPSPAGVSSLPPPRDLPASTSNFYWNALNSSRPRVGAGYLNALIVGGNMIPGPMLCEKWMTLLTWGPKLITKASSGRTKVTKTNYSFDGPRMNFALELWKKALGLYPKVVLPRMIAGAPGGLSDWWKTCLSYDELSEEDKQEEQSHGKKDDKCRILETAQTELRSLRMRSARLEAFLYLLKSNLAYEKEFHRKKLQVEHDHLQKNQSTSLATSRKDGADESLDSDDSSSDEEEEEDSASIEDCSKVVTLLREIRSFGAKAVMRLVAQAMSKFWVSQRKYLGYFCPDDPSDIAKSYMEEEDLDLRSELLSLEHERSDIVEEIAKQLADVLKVTKAILESAVSLEVVPPSRRSRRNSRRKPAHFSELSDKEVGEVLWNAMDLEVRERLPKQQARKKRKTNRKQIFEEPEPKDAFLVDWLWVLQDSLGKEFAVKLAEKVGVDEHFDALWAL